MSKVSVAMATYNGEKYIKEQVETILLNLEKEDELVVSDDGSKDGTIALLKSFNDERIKIFDGPKKGIKKNFENAIKNCSGDFIFLSDQDDTWEPGKVKAVLEVFYQQGAKVVVHNCDIVDGNGGVLVDSFFDFRKSGPGKLKNFMKNTYIGCCMAFSAELKDKIMPIPANIEMHDQWIGLVGEMYGTACFLDKKLSHYRQHESNSSTIFHHHTFGKMLANRLALLGAIIKEKVTK